MEALDLAAGLGVVGARVVEGDPACEQLCFDDVAPAPVPGRVHTAVVCEQRCGIPPGDSGTVEDAQLLHRVLKEDIIDVESQAILGRRYDAITRNLLKQMVAAKFSSVDVVDVSWD